MQLSYTFDFVVLIKGLALGFIHNFCPSLLSCEICVEGDVILSLCPLGSLCSEMHPLVPCREGWALQVASYWDLDYFFFLHQTVMGKQDSC